ncbi:hypothetical protein [Oceanihabitans sediminis]|uniref:hypothetical protein n=1 Tax=Oceanihabitans sediminis TaxID=1812012 RepID=UPI00299F4116|nr:hypothetical protein [Oceanihabitans sediminis]MDX1279445.1 hypothetical protein [Oceanihabitans sediminis]
MKERRLDINLPNVTLFVTFFIFIGLVIPIAIGIVTRDNGLLLVSTILFIITTGFLFIVAHEINNRRWVYEDINVNILKPLTMYDKWQNSKEKDWKARIEEIENGI